MPKTIMPICYNLSMTLSQITQEIDSLPPEAQKQVEDFIAFLKTRYKSSPKKRVRRIKIENEPFVGMWKDRKDMRNSVKWVKELRQREWHRL